MISITPQGVGVVEAAVVVAFTSFGVSGAAGLSIALVYRGIVFWMPFLIGAILIQTTKTFKHDAKRVSRAGKGKGKGSLQSAAVMAKNLDEKAAPAPRAHAQESASASVASTPQPPAPSAEPASEAVPKPDEAPADR